MTAFPGFRWRIATAHDEANVRYQPPRPRAPLAIGRLATEVGYRPAFDVDQAFADFAAWLGRTPGALASERQEG